MSEVKWFVCSGCNWPFREECLYLTDDNMCETQGGDDSDIPCDREECICLKKSVVNKASSDLTALRAKNAELETRVKELEAEFFDILDYAIDDWLGKGDPETETTNLTPPPAEPEEDV